MRITPAARALMAQMIRNRLGEFWRRSPVLSLARVGEDAVVPCLESFPHEQVLTPVEIIECEDFEVFLVMTCADERLYKRAIVDAYSGRLWLITPP